MALISGFYNSKKVNNVLDRPYTAKDLRKPYDVIYSDGIKPAKDGTVGEYFKVVVTDEDYVVEIKSGFAKVGGAWIENDAPVTITLNSPNSSNTKYALIKLINDESERKAKFDVEYVEDTAPSYINKVIDNGSQVCLAYVKIEPTTTEITDAMIVDTRESEDFCGVMSGTGATVLRNYYSTYYTTNTNEQNIPIGIDEYDGTFRSDLSVSINGKFIPKTTVDIENVAIQQYTVSEDHKEIRLKYTLPVTGTRVDFHVTKNVNGSVSGNVNAELESLSNSVRTINNKLEHHYYCNGVNDNINISDIIKEFQVGSDYDSMRLVVHGNFGYTNAYAGVGTSANPYVWFRLAQGATSTRKVIVDFSDCSEIRINCPSNTYNVILFGMDVNVVGANIIATGGSYIYMFSTPTNIKPYVENCRFWVTTAQGGHIAKSGTFKNCRVSYTVENGNAYVFNVGNESLLRLDGGEYYTYSTTAYTSGVVRVEAGMTNAVVITNGINCPTNARSGYVQTYSIYDSSANGKCSYRDTITVLPLAATGQQSNKIEISKAGMM